MRKGLLIVIMIMTAFLTGAAFAQDMLIFGGLSLAKEMIDRKDTRSVSTGEVAVDVYVDMHRQPGYVHGDRCHCEDKSKWSGKGVKPCLVYLATLRSSMVAQVAFGDRFWLRVKGFKNGPAPHGLKLYVNDGLHDQRKVEGDRGQGVIGGYPFVRVRDLDWGANQLKVLFSHVESASFVVNRFNPRTYHALMRDPETAVQASGFSHLSYPATPVYLVSGPQGDIHPAYSPEEAADMAKRLAVAPPVPKLMQPVEPEPERGSVMPTTTLSQPEVDEDEDEALTESDPSSLELFELYAQSYTLAGLTPEQQREFKTQLVADLENPDTRVPLGEEPLGLEVEKGKNVALLLKSSKPFKAYLTTDPEKPGDPGSALQAKLVVTNGVTTYRLLTGVVFTPNDPRILVVETEDGRKHIIGFRTIATGGDL